MASVKRYELTECGSSDGYAAMEEWQEGDWVKYVDIKALVQEAYENGKKEGTRLEEARVARHEHISKFYE